MSVNIAQVLKKYERMKAAHQLWEPLWQDLADYIFPRRAQFTTSPTPGRKRTEKLFDSTALDAHDRLASTLNGTLTSRSTEWFSLKMRNEQFNESADVKIWLEDCGKRMFNAFNQSNFAQEIHEVYLDETAFGTGGLFLEERNPESRDFAGFVFRAMPLHDICIDEDQEGRVNTVYRAFTMTAGAAVSLWGIQNVGDKINKAIDSQKPDTVFNFLHVIEPRLLGVVKNPTFSTPKTKLPWVCAYVCLDDKTMDTPIYESGYNEFPAMVPRWSKSAGEKYGRGPGHLALPDVKTLNRATELGLKTWAKVLGMPTKSRDDGVVGPIRNTEAGNTIVRNMDDIQPLFPPGTFSEALRNDRIKSSDLQASIRRIFYADQMSLPEKSYMTAFEVAKQFELMERLLGPTMGRQETELLNPLVDRAFGIMLRHSAFSAPPPILQQAGAQLDVQYEGPLARSQRLSEVEGIERLQQMTMVIAQVDPSVIDNIDYDKAIHISAEILGVSSKILRDPDEVQKMREQRAQQQAQMQQLANASTMAQAAGKAAPALKVAADAAGHWGGIPAGGSSGPAAA